MIVFLINAMKIIFLLAFVIVIHETGHFIIAKLCKVTVNEFSIGFGPTIWKKQGEKTKYSIRLIPLGGFCNMEGEEEYSEKEGSFSKASIAKRIAIVMAGALVNIIFAVLIYFILVLILEHNIHTAFVDVGNFVYVIIDGVKQIFTGNISMDQLMGPVGISETVAKTTGLINYVYLIAVISISLGVTNLMPFPPLDGGKILFLIIEAIRRKPLKQETEIKIQLIGFAALITLSIFVAYNDIMRIV